MANWAELLQSNKKWKVFGYVLLAIFIVGTILSLLTKITFIEDDKSTRPRLAVVAPSTPAGDALRKGASLYVEDVNRQGGLNGRLLEVTVVDSAGLDAQSLVTDPYLVGVVGFLDEATLRQHAPTIVSAGKRLVTPLYLAESVDGVVSLGVAPEVEASFAGNYARNIAQQRIMYVVREEGANMDALMDNFAAVYTRFNTPVQQTWTLPANATEEQLKAVIDQVKRKDIGAIFVAANPELSAAIVRGIRGTGSILDIFGPSTLASAAFTERLQQIAGDDAGTAINGISTTTPILFDTANDEAQRFRSRFQQVYGQAPDWLGALSYDAAQIALLEGNATAFQGISGDRKIVDGRIELPIQMGVYNGDALISAPIQMLPIALGANFNYVDALKDGRVLYVNDRFMFKTNVVYTGFTVHEIRNVDTLAETAELSLSMWFRYQGDFSPEDVQVLNAFNNTVAFGEPVEESDTGSVRYKRYRVEDTFKLNFTNDRRAYAHHIAGVSFRHRMLNRNNLMYVVDVLGMPTGNELISDLQGRRVTEAGSGWAVDNAWVSQDVQIERGEGAPQYVGVTGEQPLFSIITLGVEIQPASFSARDVISIEYFIYIAIFGFLGVAFANVLDSRNKAWYWAVQSWVLRVIFWPLLLLAVGNLLIDWSYTNLTQATTSRMVATYEAFWWLLGAHLANLAVTRFVWAPLEARAQRKVPNVMKILVTIMLLALAFAGIIATVFNQPLTSFLATSGVLAMIVGFAVQANIANIFSGIILNVERPFKVGDFIKINNTIGQVRDITWRTVRIESNAGPMVSMANSNVSESFMENYSEVPHGIFNETVFYAPTDVNAERVLQIIDDAIADNASILFKDDPAYMPRARYKGIVNHNGQWVAQFSAGYRVKILPKRGEAQQDMWFYVNKRCKEEGINLVPQGSTQVIPMPQESV